MTNDKQDLADQLKKCFNQLRETKSMFEREQEINNQLEKSRKQLESEKSGFQNSVKVSQWGRRLLHAQINLFVIFQDLEKENAMLKTEILKYQANREKDRLCVVVSTCCIAGSSCFLFDCADTSSTKWRRSWPLAKRRQW